MQYSYYQEILKSKIKNLIFDNRQNYSLRN